MAKKKKATKTVEPTAVREARERKEQGKSKLDATKEKRDQARADRDKTAIKDKQEKTAQRTKDFSWGSDESIKGFVEELERLAAPDFAIGDVKNPQKILVILATNMIGEPIEYKELADKANSWMCDEFAISPQSVALKSLSPERPIPAFNGRNEIWKMQQGTAKFNVIQGQEVSNEKAHGEEPRARLVGFNLISGVYEALTPELVSLLREKFKR
jgi:hypothetical protein